MSNIDKVPEASIVYDIECDDCGAIMEIHVFNELEDGVGEPIYCTFCGAEVPDVEEEYYYYISSALLSLFVNEGRRGDVCKKK